MGGKRKKKTISGYEPIPLPPVSRILCTYGMSLHLTEEERPLITPVGAAIAAVVRTMETPETFSIRRTGVGDCGEDFPGPVRAMLIEPKAGEKGEQERDTILKLETNVDDCTGEALGFVMEKLFAGARDVHYTPVFMKKNRPGWLLTVLCTEDKAQELEEILFRETTTIGIRRTRMERRVLKREQRRVETPLGEILVKVCTLEGKERWYPEYESLAKICRETGISYQEALHMAEEACLKAGQKEAGKF